VSRKALPPVESFLLLCTGVLLALVSPLSASQPAPTGSIKGVVANEATRQFLDSAEVVIESTATRTLTDYDGTYGFTGLVPGTYRLVVGYTGLDSATTTVTVVAGETSRADFNLKSAAYTMEQFVVAAEAEGSAYAANKQKKSDFMMLAVSSDSFETSADGNIGEVLKYLPGLQVNYSDASPSTVSIRGQDAAMTLFTMDGARPAAAGSPPPSSDTASRAYELNQTSVQSIESIEVYKAPPPSMPPALGGVVNIVSRSAFLQKGRRLSLYTSLNGPSRYVTLENQPGPGPRRTQWVKPGGGLSYSEAFMHNRLGVSLSVSESNLINVQHYSQTGYTYRGASAANPISAATPGYLSSYALTATPVVRQSRNLGLNFDYKWSSATTLSLRNSWNAYRQQLRQRTFRVSGGTAPTSATPADTTLTGATASMSTDFNDTRSKNLGTGLRLDHKVGPWKIDASGSYSRSESFTGDLPDYFATSTVSVAGVGVRVRTAPGRGGPLSLEQTAGPDIWRTESYGPLTSAASNPRDQNDTVESAAINIRRSFVGGKYPFYLQTGGSYGYFHRSKRSGQIIYTFAGPDGITGNADDRPNPGIFRDTVYAIRPLYGLRRPGWLDPYRIADYLETYPRSFQDLQAANYERQVQGAQRLTEEIAAAYFMGNVRLGPGSLLAGARVEHTATSGLGPQKRTGLGVGLPVNSLAWYRAVYSQPFRARSNYTDPLLQVQGTYRFNPNFIFRGALFQSIGRPDIYRILQSTVVDDTAHTVAINNVGIIPQHSNNLDLSLELYTKPSGTVTVGWFRKSIHDYIQRSVESIDAGPDNGFNGAYAGYLLTTQTNTGNARFEGFEASARQQLGSYTKWLRGVEVYGNFTRNYRAEGSFGTTSITRPLNYAAWSAAGGLGYTSPSRAWYFSVRHMVTPRTLSARATATAFARYDEAHRYWDVTARYRFLKKYALELSGSNILRDPRLKWTQGPNRPVDYREFDAQWTLTLSANVW
jgi:TonB-dependent receptor